MIPASADERKPGTEDAVGKETLRRFGRRRKGSQRRRQRKGWSGSG